MNGAATVEAPMPVIALRGNQALCFWHGRNTATTAEKSASCTLMDAQTLQCAVPKANAGLAPTALSNPGG